MKLRGINIVAPDRRRKAVAIICPGCDDAGIHRLRVKAVDEINVAAVLDAAIERTVRLNNVELVPADLRNFQSWLFREANDAALKHAKSGGAGIEFFATFKERLIADADAEKGFASLDEIARCLEQFLFTQRIDAIIERADAGQNHRARIADFVRRLRNTHVRANLEQRFVNAAQVAGAVVE